MKTRSKICIFSAVFVLLAGILLSQAYAFDDDVRVVGNGKQIVQVSPRPTIDYGEDGPDPHKALPVRSAGLGATQNVQVSQDFEAWRWKDSNRYEALWQFFLFRIRQLFW
jgi:hypothetical protein